MLYIYTAMKTTITRLRVTGVRLAQDELAHAPRITGELMMDDWITNNTFHRPIRVACLHPEGLFNLHPQLLPPLFDAKVLRITETQLFISGIENFVEDKQLREVAQAWMFSLS